MAKAKTMTVARLHKQLSEMVQNGQGWMKVAVNKRSFHHPLESDGAVILDVQSAAFTWVPLTDDDGGTATAIAAARVQALEEAVKVCEGASSYLEHQQHLLASRDCANAIRALIGGAT